MKVTSKEQEPRGRMRRLPFVPSSCEWGSIVSYLTFIFLPLALLWRPLFVGEAFFWGTPLLQFIPWQQFAANLWRSGHLPLWNPLVGCGAPLAANYQTAVFYPLNVLYLLLDAEVALTWTTALHIAMAGWGMYRWTRAAGLDRFPSLIGALALQGSGFLVARAALFPSIVLTFPWLAIWLWRAEVLIQDMRLRDSLWLGLALALGFLAGHAQTAFYGGLLLSAYLTFRAIQRTESDSCHPEGAQHDPGLTSYVSRFAFCALPRFLVALIVGLGLSAIQLLPTAELLIHSDRSTGASYDFAMTYSFWPWRLITFAAPNFFGNPGRGTYWGYATYWEDAGYVGVLPLLLAFHAVFAAISHRQKLSNAQRSRRGTAPASRSGRRPPSFARAQVLFWACAALIALILALGKNTPVFPFLFRRIPGFDLFQAPARWLTVTTLALAVLAAVGAQHWPRGRPAGRRGALSVTVGLALLIAGLTAPLLLPDIPPTFGPATARFGGVLVLAGALTLLRGHASQTLGRPAIWWQVAVGVLVVIDLLTYGWPLVPTVNRSLYHDITVSAAALHGEDNAVRVYWPTDPSYGENRAQYRVKFDYLTFDDFGPHDASYWRGMRVAQLPNTGMLDRVPSANNFDPLLVGRYLDVLDAAIETPDLLGTMGVTHVISDRPWSEGQPVYASDAATFYRRPNALGRAWIAPAARFGPQAEILTMLTDSSFDPATEVLLEGEAIEQQDESPRHSPASRLTLQDGPNRVTIRVALDAPGYLVLADTWYPGWKATLDGKPIELLRANHAFRAIHLAAGNHTIKMIYRPTSFLIGAVTSGVMLIILVFGMIASYGEKE